VSFCHLSMLSFSLLFFRFSLFPYTTLFRSDGSIVAFNCLVEPVSRLLVFGDTVTPVTLIGFVFTVTVAFSDSLSPITSVTDKERSEEHTSELQSRFDLVCRLLLENKHDRVV